MADIESDSLQAVSSLRSKFESLGKSSSRPVSPAPSPTSSAKRPPPPPRPSISPLMRPIPIPVADELGSGGVGALRNKFSSNDDTPTPTPTMQTQSEPHLSISALTARRPPPPPPAAGKIPPPRPPPRNRTTTPTPEIAVVPVAPPLPARRGTAQPQAPPSPKSPSRSLPPPPPSPTGKSRVPPPPPPPPSYHAYTHSLSASPTDLLLSPTPMVNATQSTSALLLERKHQLQNQLQTPTSTSTTPTQKPLKNGLPPPPVRTIALGDKLPPARRPATPSESDEEDDDEPSTSSSGAVDTASLPDASRSSRRPPLLGSCGVSVPAQSGRVVLVGGLIVVGAGHHLRVWDISASLFAPIYDLHTSTWIGGSKGKSKSKEIKISALCVRGEGVVWAGTKEGHLFEVDVRKGGVKAWKLSAHLKEVVFLGRWRSWVVSVDEGGKVCVWEAEDGFKSPPKVIRITDKLEFCALLTNGTLWTSSRAEFHRFSSSTSSTSNTSTSTSNTTSISASKAPVIRIYDLFSPSGSASTPQVVHPIAHCGAVTSSAVLAGDAGEEVVVLGHEEGWVSLWSSGVCKEVVKLLPSDIISMLGVGKGMVWVGSRSGGVSVFDLSPRLGSGGGGSGGVVVQMNSWAMSEWPVVALVLDHHSSTSSTQKRMPVLAVARDDRTVLYDALLLLKRTWVDERLVERESEFVGLEERKVGVVSWNCDSAKPAELDGTGWLVDMLQSFCGDGEGAGGNRPPDIISFGFQEVIDLESRKMTAKGVLIPSLPHSHSHTPHASLPTELDTRVTHAYKRWFEYITMKLKMAFPPEVGYVCVKTESLVGLFSGVWVRKELRGAVRGVGGGRVKRGMGGRWGNKGGIITRFILSDSAICFVNCHLAAGQHALRSRNADVVGILEGRDLFDGNGAGAEGDGVVAEGDVVGLGLGAGGMGSGGVGSGSGDGAEWVGGGDGSMVLDHEVVFWNGDMNYRIDQRRDTILSLLASSSSASNNPTPHAPYPPPHVLSQLLAHDQLLKEIKYNKGCRMRLFEEGQITFAPTYKYDPGTDTYDSSEKRRAPAWCDRILWRAPRTRKVEQVQGSYRRWEVNVSDHRPVSAVFKVKVKSVRSEVRASVREEVGIMWSEEEERILKEMEEWFRRRGVL
ncbi:hypothetical protein VNI00_010491 [Paramarasmius palmivorus]|uniref:Inositol polyphosphate-related phosphatase domain-containing protein n=1 Tax=Paramarasmius palmivorus TaxID=297713 RepID=A0AAW0CLB7_9AGAR